MSDRDIEPLKLAVRFDPPLLALLYSKGGTRKFLHEFPLTEEDLFSQPQEVLGALLSTHPGYLDKINSDQILHLIEMVQAQYEQDPAHMQGFLHGIKSRMTEEQYQEFMSRMEAEEFEEDYDEEDIDQMERDVREHGGLDEEEEDF